MLYIGIDIAEGKFDYCIIDSGLNRIRSGIIANNSNGYNDFLEIIGNYDNARIGMESTNIYHLNLYSFLIGHNYNPLLLNSIETKIIKKSRIRKNKTDRIDSEAMAGYLIISGNNTVNMCEYPELKEYANTYFRINKKITAAKNTLIRDLDLLYPGMSSIIDINARYFNEIINNIDNIKNGNYKIKYIDAGKNAILKPILSTSNNNSNAVKYDIKINIDTIALFNKQLNETLTIMECIYNNIDSKIKTIPGIGVITGSVILSNIGNINRFDSVVKLRAYE